IISPPIIPSGSVRHEPKKRIDTNAAQTPLAGVGAAFAGVDLPSLPAGPEPGATTGGAPTPAPDSPQRIWKMGRVVLRRETARRGGKTVIVIHDFATHLPPSVIEMVAKKIR